MVKKVIDIIPPGKPGDEEKEQEEVIEDLPSIAPCIETPAKPRITFVAPEAGNIPPKKNWNLGGAPGFLFKLAVLLGLFALALCAIDAKYARAVVSVTPRTNQVSASGNVSVDQKLTAADKVGQSVPGAAVTVDKDFSGDFKASGKTSTQTKAKGTVKITNNYTNAQRLIAGTRLQAPSDKFTPALAQGQNPWFRTVSDVTIQPKQSATVSVVADSPGTAYNIAPSAFSIPGLAGTPQYTYILAQSSEKFTGGADSTALQVTRQDLDNAKNSLTGIIADQMKGELQNRASAGQVLIPETANITISNVVPSVSAGTVQDTFSFKAKVHASAVAVYQKDLDSFGKDIILNNTKNGLTFDSGSLKVVPAYVKTDAATGLVFLSLMAQGLEYKFDADNIRQTLAGESAAEAQTQLLNDISIQSAKITLTPFWRTSLPKDRDRIIVNLNR